MKNKLKEEVLKECKEKLKQDWELDESMLDYAIDLTLAEMEKEIQENYVHKSLIIKPDDWIRKDKVKKLIDDFDLTSRGKPADIYNKKQYSVKEWNYAMRELLKELKQKLGGEDE